MSRFIRPLVDYFYQEFFYILCDGYRKDWTRKELTYVDVTALMQKKPRSPRRKLVA